MRLARALDSPVDMLVNFAGDTPAAFFDPARVAELARSQIARGADVIVGVAGVSGNGQSELLESQSDIRSLSAGRVLVGGHPLPPSRRWRGSSRRAARGAPA